jgi:hypothetical protein
MAARGRFLPKFPDKYLGDPTKIFFRSAWEVRAMKFFDASEAVLKWGSEELKIPYLKPTDARVHYYYPDFIVVYRDKTGAVQKEIIEIKPLKESVQRANMTDYDKLSLIINDAKWKAADLFARQHGMKFRVITEASLFKQAPKQPRRPRKRA